MIRKLVFVLIAMLATFVWAARQDAKIAPGDKIKLSCVEEPSLDREYKVTSDGYVLVDFLGAVKVEGLTEREAAAKIAENLVTQKIVKSATVDLAKVGTTPNPAIGATPVAASPVKFRGVCATQGELAYKQGLSLGDLVQAAKPTSEADMHRVSITSVNGTTRVVDFSEYDPATKAGDIQLEAGDTVTFISRSLAVIGKVKVGGEVVTPGEYDLTEGMKLKDFIDKAGGLVSDAEHGYLRLTRVGDADRKLKLPDDLDAKLMPGDTITADKVLQKLVVKIDGFVRSAGDVELTEGSTLTEALKTAGGATEDADLSKVRVYMPDSEKPRVIDLNEISQGYTGDVDMRKGMRIEVPNKRGKLSNATVRTAAGAAILFFLVGL